MTVLAITLNVLHYKRMRNHLFMILYHPCWNGVSPKHTALSYMFQDILYPYPDVQISSKDQELEFEKRENPYEKELTPQEAVAQKGSKEGSSISGNFLGKLGFFKMQHTWEKLPPDDTEER